MKPNEAQGIKAVSGVGRTRRRPAMEVWMGMTPMIPTVK